MARALARDPERRYADAAEMEEALRDGLRGVAPRPDRHRLDPRAGTDPTEATRGCRATPRHAAPRRRRRLEPMAEPRRPPGAAAAPRPQAAPPAAPPRPPPLDRCCSFVLALARPRPCLRGHDPSSNQAVQLGGQRAAKVHDAVDQLKDLIQDNTR